MAWFAVLGLNLTMGVAWHRFTVWPNIWFKRESSGKPALGALQPITVGGKPLDFAEIEDLDADVSPRRRQARGLQLEGPARLHQLHRVRPLPVPVPRMEHREAALAQAVDHGPARARVCQGPLSASGRSRARRVARVVRDEAARPLVGPIQVENGLAGVIDPDVLWSCTTCGACVQQCPVDIEHVDHILDMRRFQVLMESEFPTELNGLFKGLENKGNPWNISARGGWTGPRISRFQVPVVGEDVEDLSKVEYLFWVGCAGAYEDRAKKTTQAVAELLHIAGVSFAVLGNGETCTGDPARRAGNEFVFQQLAMQNAETLQEANATKIVVTCAHCLNALKNEYPQLGVSSR